MTKIKCENCGELITRVKRSLPNGVGCPPPYCEFIWVHQANASNICIAEGSVKVATPPTGTED